MLVLVPDVPFLNVPLNYVLCFQQAIYPLAPERAKKRVTVGHIWPTFKFSMTHLQILGGQLNFVQKTLSYWQERVT